MRNLVATARIADELDLSALLSHRAFRGTAVRHSQWVGVRWGERRRYVALYANGKALSAGCASESEALAILRGVAEVLERIPPSNLVIENIVAVADMGRVVDLHGLSQAVAEAEYEPEQFPAVVLRLASGATALVFKSGKLVVTGSRSHAAVRDALEGLEEILYQTS